MSCLFLESLAILYYLWWKRFKWLENGEPQQIKCTSVLYDVSKVYKEKCKVNVNIFPSTDKLTIMWCYFKLANVYMELIICHILYNNMFFT